jgi:hypothetical protein
MAFTPTHKLLIGRNAQNAVAIVAGEADLEDARKLARLDQDLPVFQRIHGPKGLTFSIVEAEYVDYDTTKGGRREGIVAGREFYPFRLAK